jgi:hypothetical protein
MSDDIPTMAAKAYAKREAEEAHKARVERLAKKLYEAWTDPETYEIMTGKDKPAWYIEGVAYVNGGDLCLAQHQRDDYREQAEKLLDDPELSITFK